MRGGLTRHWSGPGRRYSSWPSRAARVPVRPLNGRYVMRQEHPVEAIEYATLRPLRRSGVGIASFWVAAAGAATLVAVFNLAIVGRPASDMMVYKLLGLVFILPAVGTVLGVVSLLQRRRHRGLPIAGLAINMLLALFLLLIIVPALGHELRFW